MTKPPVVAISGATGLIGSALSRALREDRIEVRHLVRRAATGPHEIPWNPGTPLDPAALSGVTAVVHLAGAGVADRRWTKSYKRTIRESRTLGTTTIARAVAAMDDPVSVLVSGSAIGYYGETGGDPVDETAPQGTGFLADVVREWEAAADPARDAGIRVVHPRTGLVLSSKAGTYKRMLPFFRAGVGGRLGTGRQYWSWISLRDEIAALRFLIDQPLEGPVNLTAPNAVTNAEVTAAIGEVLRRPVVLPVPAFALRIYLGGFASEVLGSLRVYPQRLLDAGFTWQDTTVAEAITAAHAGW
jgi:uncharacterized protein (TIGR01777 family)